MTKCTKEGQHKWLPSQSQVGYALLSRSSSGSVSVKTLMAQEYIAFLEQNISTRHPIVSASGPMTATFLLPAEQARALIEEVVAGVLVRMPDAG